MSAAVAAALAVPSFVYAQAQGLEVRLSGQVNRALMNVDDGTKSNAFFVDNSISSTRFRLSAAAPITPGLRAGAVFETEFQSNPSGDVSFDPDGDNAADIEAQFAERHMDVFFEGGWGKVSLGQGDGAANGGTEVDLSGTSVAHWSGASSIGGGFQFRDSAGALIAGRRITNVINNQDFESRYDRLRYDTPKFGGFSVAASWGTKDAGRDVRELAAFYSGDLGALGRLAGAIGWSNQQADVSDPTAVEDEVIGGSISWLHGSGLNVTFAHSQREASADRDRTFTYAKVGYKFGRHAVSLDWGLGEDQAAADVEGDMIGIGYVWNPVAWAELYAAAKRHSLDAPGVDADDINIVMIGTRIRF